MTLPSKLPDGLLELKPAASEKEFLENARTAHETFDAFGGFEGAADAIRHKPGFKRTNCRTLLLNGRKIGGVNLHRANLSACGTTFSYIGVGEVVILPEFRGQGFGGRMMAAIVDEIEASDADFSFLFTDRSSFYEPFGWTRFGEWEYFLPAGAPDFIAPGQYSVRALPWSEFERLKPLYERFYEASPGMEKRKPGDWRRLTRRLQNRGIEIAAAFHKEEKQISAAAALWPKGDALTLTEALHLPGRSDGQKALLRWAIGRARRDGKTFVTARLPEGHTLGVKMVMQGGGRAPVYARHILIRDPAALLRKLELTLSERLAKRNSEDFSLQIPFRREAISIVWRGRQKKLSFERDGARPAGRPSMDGPAAALLLGLGPEALNPLLQSLPASGKRAAAQLAPGRSGIFQELDAF